MSRLAAETSPYLRRYVDSLIDWYPWADEALLAARAADKPIFLSIGFSTCHWCHEMARNSFSDRDVAAILNRDFVSIKVDREERPDLDRIYGDALLALTGRAGWPATLILTPELTPIAGGTYFPPGDQDGLRGLTSLLNSVIDSRRGHGSSAPIAVSPPAAAPVGMPPSFDADELLATAAAELEALYDSTWGGIGSAPKFPAPPLLSYLLDRCSAGDQRARTQLELTLARMAAGGIYDQVGGGFHRYAIDRRWCLPHFEKTLLDNALLARAYIAAAKDVRVPMLRRVAAETLDYMLAELGSAEGGLCSAQDADSDGREGGYYTWSATELRGLVGPELAAALGAVSDGNWAGVNVLHRCNNPDLELDRRTRATLLTVRRARDRPTRDDKIVAAFNGAAISALVAGATLLEDDRYLDAAIDAAKFVTGQLVRSDGRLMRSWCAGRTSTTGFLDDYALVGLGCLDLHTATLDTRWLDLGLRLAAEVGRLFGDPHHPTLYLTGHDVASPGPRPIDRGSIAAPSATSVAVELMLRAAHLSGQPERWPLGALEPLLAQAGSRPEEHLHALQLLASSRRERRTLVIIGERDDPATLSLAAVAWSANAPEMLTVSAPDDHRRAGVFEHRHQTNERPIAFLCAGHRCLAPTSDPDELARQLEVP